MNNKEFAENALLIAKNTKNSYLLGGFGHIANKSNLNRLLNQYPENYSWIGKAQEIIGQGYYFDCVGLIKSIAWNFDFDLEHVYGGAIYTSNGFPDIDADSLINRCANVTSNLSNAIPGEIVHMQGHVGIVVSPTQVVECTPSGSCGVQITDLFARGWKKKGRLPWIEYGNITASVPTNTIPLSPTSVAYADYFDPDIAGRYTIDAFGGLNIRNDGFVGAKLIKTLPNGSEIVNYGYYSLDEHGTKWFLVIAEDGTKGFVSSYYLVR